MKKKNSSVPDESVFRDRAKEASYWEKNYRQAWKTGKPVKVTFAKNLSETINIRLDPDILTRVRDTARQKGLGPTQLIRMWIMEHV